MKKIDDNQAGGEALCYSKEGAGASDNVNTAPRLILLPIKKGRSKKTGGEP